MVGKLSKARHVMSFGFDCEFACNGWEARSFVRTLASTLREYKDVTTKFEFLKVPNGVSIV